MQLWGIRAVKSSTAFLLSVVMRGTDESIYYKISVIFFFLLFMNLISVIVIFCGSFLATVCFCFVVGIFALLCYILSFLLLVVLFHMLFTVSSRSMPSFLILLFIFVIHCHYFLYPYKLINSSIYFSLLPICIVYFPLSFIFLVIYTVPLQLRYYSYLLFFFPLCFLC